MNEAKIEATKEALRYVLFLLVSWILTGAINYLVSVPQNEAIAILTIVLRWLDKYLYKESGYQLAQF
jgi:hypothetical protein